jgi:hypothetical protein
MIDTKLENVSHESDDTDEVVAEFDICVSGTLKE